MNHDLDICSLQESLTFLYPSNPVKGLGRTSSGSDSFGLTNGVLKRRVHSTSEEVLNVSFLT